MSAIQTQAPGDLVWVRGFGGVHINSIASWPAQIADVANVTDTKVLKGNKPGRVLINSFGDHQYVWAKPEQLSALTTWVAKEALTRASARVAPAIEEALAYSPRAKPKKRSRKEEQEAEEAPESPTKKMKDEDDGLCAYERQRLSNIKANALVLEALGVADAAKECKALGGAATEKAAVDPAVRAARAAERAAAQAEAFANRRTSSRVVAAGAGGLATPTRFSDEWAEDDEEDLRALKRARKMVRKAGTGGRGSRGGKDAQAALSPEERAAVAAAYEEASGWLEAMRRFFTDKLSEANLRNVMKQATALATGEGIPHTRKNTMFRKGEPVTLDEDLVELRAAANRFLLPEDDPGHGWRLDHPIGKMGLFQAHLHLKNKGKK